MTAEALLCRQYLGWPHDSPALIKGVGQVVAHLKQSGERNIYYWYYATQLLHNMQNKDWPRWNVKVRDGLVDMQVTGTGCDRGSWDPLQPIPDRWARTGGRLYLTSLSLLTLEVYYRYLPLYRPSDTDNPARTTGETPRPEGATPPSVVRTRAASRRPRPRGEGADRGPSTQGTNWFRGIFL